MTQEDPREKLARLMAQKAAAQSGLFSDRFDAAARQYAVQSALGDLSYQELHQEVFQTVGRFQGLGLKRGDVIAVTCDSGEDFQHPWVALYLAVIYGGFTLLLPDYATDNPAVSLATYSDLGARLIILPDSFQDFHTDTAEVIRINQFLQVPPAGTPVQRPLPQQAAMLAPESGFYVPISQELLAQRIRALQSSFPLPSASTVGSGFEEPITTESLLHCLLWPLCAGASYQSSDDEALTALYIQGESDKHAEARLVLTNGQGCNSQHHALLTLPASGAILSHATPQKSVTTRLRAGKPLESCYILDAYMQKVPLGQEGFLAIPEKLAAGYWNEAIQTALDFVPDPFSQDTGARLYLSKLKARFRDGQLLCERPFVGGRRYGMDHVLNRFFQYGWVRDAYLRSFQASRHSPNRHILYLVIDEHHLNHGSKPWLVGDVDLKTALIELEPKVLVLDALPLCEDGSVDEEALAAIPILEDAVLDQERELSEVLGIPVLIACGAVR